MVTFEQKIDGRGGKKNKLYVSLGRFLEETIANSLRWENSEYLMKSKEDVVVQTVNNLPAMQETWVRSLSQEDPLEKEMTTHSSILAWTVLWTEEPGVLQSMVSQRVSYD